MCASRITLPVTVSVIAQHDPKDSTCINLKKRDYTETLGEKLRYMRIGVPGEFFREGLDLEIKKAVLHGVRLLQKEGLESEEVSLLCTCRAQNDRTVIERDFDRTFRKMDALLTSTTAFKLGEKMDYPRGKGSQHLHIGFRLWDLCSLGIRFGGRHVSRMRILKSEV